jgi:peptide/nickel transport system permease protein
MRALGRAGLQAIAVAFGVVLVTFLLVHLVPGDTASTILGPRASEESLAALRAELNLDRSLPAQFGMYLGDLARGDLGTSISRGNRPVLDVIGPRVGVTLSIIVATLFISALVGVVLGLLAGLSKKRAVDPGIRVAVITMLGTPTFYIGLLLILFVGVRWGLAPAGGWGDGWPDNFRYLWLPSLALSFYLIPIMTRAVRQAARDTEREQFIEAAIVRGLSPRRVVWRHILPNSALPLVTLIGYNAAALIAGAVVVEAVFGIPGLGTELVRATGRRDYPVVQGVALVAGLFVVFVNLLTDAVYRGLDPRLRVRS